MEDRRDAGWWFRRWASDRVLAGMTTRHTDLDRVLRYLPSSPVTVAAEQVHGASIAIIEGVLGATSPIAGCDALVTGAAGLALLIRTADCLPIFFADPLRRIVGMAHAGWRGLAAALPVRMVSTFRHVYHSRPDDLHVAIGPAIRACCYEVGGEFSGRFDAFVRQRGDRRTCDLIGVARDQLVRCGVRPDRIVDTHHCTSCESEQWFSLRREGPETGRLTSWIMLRP